MLNFCKPASLFRSSSAVRCCKQLTRQLSLDSLSRSTGRYQLQRVSVSRRIQVTSLHRQYRTFANMSDDISLYTLPNDQPVVNLDCETAFNALTPTEKSYAHYLSQAAWNGGLIVFVQTSPESPLIFAILHNIFLAESIADLKKTALAAGVTEDEFTAFLVYTCGVLSNAGNYKGAGDSKIIPNLPKDKFELIIKASKAYKDDASSLQFLWDKVKEDAYNLEGNVKSLGLGSKGITTYFSANCTEEDAKLVAEYMQEKRLDAYNTRCFKTEVEGDNYKCKYEIRLASTETSDDPKVTFPEEIFKGAQFKIIRGDYDLLLLSVVENLKKAKEHAANETEVNMVSKYIEHFVTGSLEEHKNGSRFWIKDKGPIIETYIGFIENYRDPAGQRGEFEGFVAIVNKEMSKKFQTLVESAETWLPLLPWGQDFEKDKFLRPDFTSIDVLTFSGSMIPAGINIPNYDEIRQSEGFKNVSLGNVIPASMKQDVIPFLSEEDQTLMMKYRVESFEVQVGLHELLGHGSGKLLRKEADGKYNFDIDKVKSLIDGKPITKFYKEGESYDSVFGSLGSSYEECRAEAVGLYLSLEKDVIKIFGSEGKDAEDIIYVNWLSLFWVACGRALENYQPATKKWMQAHAQARYVLLRVCLEAGEDFIKIVETEPGKNLSFVMDKSKMHTVGKKAIGDFLKKLQFFKSTADVKAAQEMYNKYSEVPEDGPHPWAKWRDIVLAHKKPRKIFVQSNTTVDESGQVVLKNYEPTFEGMIESWMDRFPSPNVSENLIKLWERDQKFFYPVELKN